MGECNLEGVSVAFVLGRRHVCSEAQGADGAGMYTPLPPSRLYRSRSESPKYEQICREAGGKV